MILTIPNSDGDWRSELEQIRKTFVSYYNELFRSTNPEPIVGEFSFRSMIKPEDTVGLCRIPPADDRGCHQKYGVD